MRGAFFLLELFLRDSFLFLSDGFQLLTCVPVEMPPWGWKRKGNVERWVLCKPLKQRANSNSISDIGWGFDKTAPVGSGNAPSFRPSCKPQCFCDCPLSFSVVCNLQERSVRHGCLARYGVPRTQRKEHRAFNKHLLHWPSDGHGWHLRAKQTPTEPEDGKEMWGSP